MREILKARFAILCLLLIASCTNPRLLGTVASDINRPGSTPTPSESTVILLTSSPWPLTPPSYPTLSADEAREELNELLSSDAECYLPCWWGINPGETSFSDASILLRQLSLAAEESDFTSNRAFSFFRPYQFETLSVMFSISIDKATEEDVTELLQVYAMAGREFETEEDGLGIERAYNEAAFNEMFADYGVSGLLTTFGVPDQVLLDKTTLRGEGLQLITETTVIYVDEGIIGQYDNVDLTGTLYNGKIAFCPQETFIQLWLVPQIENRAKDYQDILLGIEGAGWEYYFPEPSGTVVSLFEATGLTTDDFYSLYREPNQECLLVPEEMWIN